MNLGKDDSASAPRRGWTRQFSAMGVAVAIGVFGLVGVHSTEGRADAVAALDWPAVSDVDPVVELPIPPPTTVPPPVETTTTTVPEETTTPTTTPPLPVETTTTTVAPPTPPPATQPKAKAPTRSADTAGPQAQAQVEAIADSTGWNWRAAGVRFAMGFYPADCCHWGVYESAKSIIWIGPTAFADQNRLSYVVLHELAHAWQYRQNRFERFISDYSAWGFTTIGPALEAGADCLAGVWGAAASHYWRCTGDARALASRRLVGDWR